MRGSAKICRGSLIRLFTTRIGWNIIARAANGQRGVDASCGGRRFNHHRRQQQQQKSTVGCALTVMFQNQQTGKTLCPEVMRVSPLSRRLLKEEMNWAMLHERHHNGSNVHANRTQTMKSKESSRFLHLSVEAMFHEHSTPGERERSIARLYMGTLVSILGLARPAMAIPGPGHTTRVD